MNRIAMFAAAAVATVIASPALAKGKPAKVAIGVTAGSLGAGPEASVTIGRDFDVRGNVTFFQITRNFDSYDVSYGGRVKLASAGAMVDYHIGGGGFFIAGGVRLNKNQARAFATPTGDDVTIGENEYTPAQIGTLRAKADFTPIAPTLTTGWSEHLTKGLKLGIEAGAMFSGGVRFHPFTASGGGVDRADLEQERQHFMNEVKDVTKYKVYPVLQLTLGYHF